VVRPENVRLAADGVDAPNRFTARVEAQHYQGVQTVYRLAVLGGRIEALELGTAGRYATGSAVDLVLPPELCWAYPARDGKDLGDV
jgi:iron(III) transport system ATP-binding protein